MRIPIFPHPIIRASISIIHNGVGIATLFLWVEIAAYLVSDSFQLINPKLDHVAAEKTLLQVVQEAGILDDEYALLVRNVIPFNFLHQIQYV